MKSLGERSLDVAWTELRSGVREDPVGSNTGPRVKEYLVPCLRGDRNVKLNLVASNWCSAFACWCQMKALEEGEQPAHGYRAGVVELVADAIDDKALWTGAWIPIAKVIDEEETPKIGDLAIYDRSVLGRPETSWWRHVNRVCRYDKETGLFAAIGGNERQKVSLSEQTITNSRLLGFLSYPGAKKEPKPAISDEERAQLAKQVYLSIDGILRDSVWG